MPLRVTLPDGSPGDPQCGVTPLMVQLEKGVYRVIGTGFYVTRYGLLLTAKHVVEEVADADSDGRATLAWNWTTSGELFMKPILTCSFFNEAPRNASDIAVCQAVDSARNGNIVVKTITERVGLLPAIPEPNSLIGTYAYPGNAYLDFRDKTKPVSMFADVFEGRMLAVLGPHERFLRYEHFETSIDVRAGASGGPVFHPSGHACAVNCRGWDLGSEPGCDPLSSVVPIAPVLDLRIPMPHMPAGSFESNSVPQDRRNTQVTLRELASWGHLALYPVVV
jgi:hypothetical protein